MCPRGPYMAKWGRGKVKQRPKKERLLRKKYMGKWRWGSTQDSRMMLELPRMVMVNKRITTYSWGHSEIPSRMKPTGKFWSVLPVVFGIMVPT